MLLGAMGIVCGLVIVVTLAAAVREADSVAREVAGRALPAQSALRRTYSASTNGQDLFITAIQTQDPVTRATALNAAQQAGQLQNASWSVYLQHAIDRPGERALQRSYTRSAARSVKLAADLLGTSPADPSFAPKLADERRESALTANALASLASKIYEPAMQQHATTIVSGISGARTAVYISYAIVALIFGSVGLWLMRGSRRDDRRMVANAVSMETQARYANLETSLQRALEMEHTEAAAYDVIAQALKIVDASVPSEMLVADSSRAHFRQVLNTAPDADAACRVGAPGDCPAAMSGQTRHFSSSSELDTCPFLRGRDDEVWATCVPVAIAGRTTGVLHMQRTVELPPPETSRGWDLVARKAGDRLGMLRAFARAETQAHTDPLTGLLNRRSLEALTRDLIDEGLPFVVAYGDLDHFKLLNDVHGHDTGDRALRLFARVLRDNVRPNDIPARYGGEEFVAVLPDCSLDNAVIVVERVRARLQAALSDGTVPPFTVSFGLATSEAGLTFSETVDAADQALLLAKREGRDRIVIAGAEPADDMTAAAPSPGPVPAP